MNDLTKDLLQEEIDRVFGEWDDLKTQSSYDSLNDPIFKDYWIECKHMWIDTGVPGGSRWCKNCDIDYEEFEALQSMKFDDLLDEEEII